jgi:hypothetical protein
MAKDNKNDSKKKATQLERRQQRQRKNGMAIRTTTALRMEKKR